MNIISMKFNYLEEVKHIPLDKSISPLILASYLGRLEIVKLLLSNTDTEVDFASNDTGYTALIASCISGFYEIAEHLIAKGANIFHKNKEGFSALYYCFCRLEEESNYFENKRLCFKLVNLLLEKGVNIDDVINSNKGYTMLMTFCAVKKKTS